jgi:hypothetical protein
MYRNSDSAGNLKDKVSIDGRTNVNPTRIAELNGAAYSGLTNWYDYFNEVQPNSVIWKNGSPLTALLTQDLQWCRIYCDGNDTLGYSVFVKREYFLKNRDYFWKPEDCPKIEPECVYKLELNERI